MKFYLTAAIPYVNAKPHIGHALEFVEGDVIARYHRAKGDEVFYLTGTDENSLKVLQAAEKEGKDTLKFADEYSAKFREFLSLYNISFDTFVRTTSAEHIASVQELWKRCNDSGDIYKKAYKGLYCVGCELFYTREELTDKGECHLHPGKPVEEVEEENYFFKLSKYQDQLLKLIDSDEYKVVPVHRKNEALGFIRQGLEDFSVSRSTKRSRGWGVPVPGDETQIMYVWFDALNVYRSGAPEHWPAKLHIVGKDIMRFHAIYWPAMLLSAKLPLPKELFVHGFVTVDGQKMSKSIGNVVDPVELVQKFGLDGVRYYLLREIPSTDDGDFSEEKFKLRYNADLANGLGNFASRVLTLSEKLNPWSLSADMVSLDVKHAITEVRKELAQAVDERRLHDAVAQIWRLVSLGDKMVNATEPWSLKDDDPKKRQVLGELLVVLAEIATLVAPFLPETAAVLQKCLNRSSETIVAVHKPEKPLFARL